MPPHHERGGGRPLFWREEACGGPGRGRRYAGRAILLEPINGVEDFAAARGSSLAVRARRRRPTPEPLGFRLWLSGGLVEASQARFVDRGLDVGAFDFEDGARLALAEESRAERLLKTDRFVRFIAFRGRHLS
jgi:hypothetical protein